MGLGFGGLGFGVQDFDEGLGFRTCHKLRVLLKGATKGIEAVDGSGTKNRDT